MWHLLMAHQQESFLLVLFFPAKSLLLPKPHGKKEHPKTTWSSLFTLLKLHDPLPCLPKPCGPPSSPSEAHGPLSMAAATRFKSQHRSSSAAPFPTPPTISYTCQHSLFFLFWAAIVSLGRCGPMAWSQSSPSFHADSVTRGSCFPVTSWVEVTPIPLAQSMGTAI